MSSLCDDDDDGTEALDSDMEAGISFLFLLFVPQSCKSNTVDSQTIFYKQFSVNLPFRVASLYRFFILQFKKVIIRKNNTGKWFVFSKKKWGYPSKI